jgi:hypothetical protein
LSVGLSTVSGLIPAILPGVEYRHASRDETPRLEATARAKAPGTGRVIFHRALKGSEIWLGRARPQSDCRGSAAPINKFLDDAVLHHSHAVWILVECVGKPTDNQNSWCFAND